jgi:transposase-like protein
MNKATLDDTHRRRLVDDFHRSGLTMAQFGARHDVHPSTLNTWVRKFRHRPAPPSPTFLELRLPDAAPAPAPAPLRIRPDDRRLTIEVPPHADLDQLRALLDALC